MPRTRSAISSAIPEHPSWTNGRLSNCAASAMSGRRLSKAAALAIAGALASSRVRADFSQRVQVSCITARQSPETDCARCGRDGSRLCRTPLERPAQSCQAFAIEGHFESAWHHYTAAKSGRLVYFHHRTRTRPARHLRFCPSRSSNSSAVLVDVPDGRSTLDFAARALSSCLCRPPA